MSNKFLVNLAFDIVVDNTVDGLIVELTKLLKEFAKEKFVSVSQVNVHQLKDPTTGLPLEVNSDGTPKVKEFHIKNVITDVL